MADLDVTDLLSDPDFCTTFDVIRTAMVVGSNGKNTPTTTTFPAVTGVVTPAGTSDLQRLSDLERISGAISVRTTFRLTDVAPGFTADQVIWPAGGAEAYTVDLLDDWTQFGRGFVVATCRHNGFA